MHCETGKTPTATKTTIVLLTNVSYQISTLAGYSLIFLNKLIRVIQNVIHTMYEFQKLQGNFESVLHASFTAIHTNYELYTRLSVLL